MRALSPFEALLAGDYEPAAQVLNPPARPKIYTRMWPHLLSAEPEEWLLGGRTNPPGTVPNVLPLERVAEITAQAKADLSGIERDLDRMPDLTLETLIALVDLGAYRSPWARGIAAMLRRLQEGAPLRFTHEDLRQVLHRVPPFRVRTHTQLSWWLSLAAEVPTPDSEWNHLYSRLRSCQNSWDMLRVVRVSMLGAGVLYPFFMDWDMPWEPTSHTDVVRKVERMQRANTKQRPASISASSAPVGVYDSDAKRRLTDLHSLLARPRC